jgi:peptide/nickel transport system substrate-binding protein
MFLLLAAGAARAADPSGQKGLTTYAIAMHGQPALPANFSRLPYADPQATKGGHLALAYQGTFDSLNPYNLSAGSTAQGLIGNVFQSLMLRSLDEPFTLYGLIAQSIETDDARSYVTFRLDPRARFSDGVPVSAADVLFTFDLLKQKGRPQQRDAFGRVKRAEALDPMTVRFDLSGSDGEMPLTLATMPVLPKQDRRGTGAQARLGHWRRRQYCRLQRLLQRHAGRHPLRPASERPKVLSEGQSHQP